MPTPVHRGFFIVPSFGDELLIGAIRTGKFGLAGDQLPKREH